VTVHESDGRPAAGVAVRLGGGLMTETDIEVGSAELAVPASWVRGGTSKCWIFQAADVDALPVSRDEFLLRAFGSPDLRQIDGISGVHVMGLGSQRAVAKVVETARVDKQLGSGSSASGSTSVTEKGAVPEILAFAVENGALTKSQSGTTISFKGNPVGIVNSLIAIYHPRINYPGFNVPSGTNEEPAAGHLTYAQPADVPINPSGEVEEEAVSRTDPEQKTDS